MLPHCHADRLMCSQTLPPSALLIPVSMSQPIIAGAHPVYIVIVGILSFAFFFCCAPLPFRQSNVAARRTYLPLVLIVILLGKH